MLKELIGDCDERDVFIGMVELEVRRMQNRYVGEVDIVLVTFFFF